MKIEVYLVAKQENKQITSELGRSIKNLNVKNLRNFSKFKL